MKIYLHKLISLSHIQILISLAFHILNSYYLAIHIYIYIFKRIAPNWNPILSQELATFS